MDVQLTAVDARSGRSADVVLVVEKDSTVADAARALRAALGLPASSRATARLGPAGAEVWIAGRPVDPTLPMTVSPLREGAVVGLGGPVGPGRARPGRRRRRRGPRGRRPGRRPGAPAAAGRVRAGQRARRRGLRGRRLGRGPAGPAAGHPAGGALDAVRRGDAGDDRGPPAHRAAGAAARARWWPSAPAGSRWCRPRRRTRRWCRARTAGWPTTGRRGCLRRRPA